MEILSRRGEEPSQPLTASGEAYGNTYKDAYGKPAAKPCKTGDTDAGVVLREVRQLLQSLRVQQANVVQTRQPTVIVILIYVSVSDSTQRLM